MRTRLKLSLFVAILAAGVVYPQTPSNDVAPTAQGRGQIDINVLSLPLMVSVTDNKGKLVTTLTKDDFRVYEEDKLQTIKSFSRDTDLPLSIALLIDSSGSVIEKVKFEKAAATDFFFST